MNKNRLGMAWLLLTAIMVGMSLSPMVDNNVLSVDETVGTTEIVEAQNNDFDEEDKSKDWAQEEQMNEEQEDVDLNEENLANVLGGPGQTRGTTTDVVAEEIISEAETDADGRVIDQACTGDFNLDLDGDADLVFDPNLGYDAEEDAAPELMEDFQSDDDFDPEFGWFAAADSNWDVRDTSFTSWGPDNGISREVIMSGQRLYAEYQTAYLSAGDHTLEMTDTYGDGWNGNTIKFVNSDGVAVDQATLGTGSFGEAIITIPEDGFYSTDWTTGSWQGEVYWTLKTPDYNLGGGGGGGGGGFVPDALPFSMGATGGTVKSMAAGLYDLTMTDSWGDGWNGNSLQIYDDSGTLILNDYLDPYCQISWWQCSEETIPLNIPANGDYTFVLGGGSWQSEIGITVEPVSVSIPIPSQYYMQTSAQGAGDGAAQTTTCINAGDYNQIFVSFAYHMYGTSSQYSRLRLDVRATDDVGNGPEFFNGQWETVWEKRGSGNNNNWNVDPIGVKNGDWWFTENQEITSKFCNTNVGCAEELTFRFHYDGGGSTRDDYAVDNFRVQAFGQFSDRDYDGVPDALDDCDGADNTDGTPNAEFDHSVFADLQIGSNGCPPDTDGDGTFDIVDYCPSTPSGLIATADVNGCEDGLPMTSNNVLADGRVMETLAHVESFNSDQSNPMNENIDDRGGWTAIEDNGFYNWQIYTLYNAGKYEGDRSIVHAETNSDFTDEAWMISPMINIPADSEFGNKMSFAMMIEYFAWWGTYGYNSGEFAIYASQDSCQPAVGNPGNGQMMNLMQDFDGDGSADPLYTVPYGLGMQSWEEQIFKLEWPEDSIAPGTPLVGDWCFAFRNAAPTSGSMFLDLFQWYVQPTPPDMDNDGVWDAYPESTDANGNLVYGADAGEPIDLCNDTPKGQAVIGMTMGVVGGVDARPLSSGEQAWDVGCSAPLALPYNQDFAALNMPAEIQFGSSDGDGIQTDAEDATWRALWNYYGPCGYECLGIVMADDFPQVRYETKYMVMPMIEISTNFDGVFLSWWDYVGWYYQWSNALSYHAIEVAVVNQENSDRSCEVGKDQDNDLDGDEILDADGEVINYGYEQIANIPNPGSYGWFEHEVDLSSYVGKWVCVAFAFRSDGDQEWRIDDINMRGVILPPDLEAPSVVEFNPYTGVETYRADGRVVDITLADGESGVDNGQAPTLDSTPPTIDWSMSDGTSGSIAMSETGDGCDMGILPYMDRECSFTGTLPEVSAPGVTMTYSVTFQDVGFKTNNNLVHPVTQLDTACMDLNDFITLATPDENGEQAFEPPVPEATVAAVIDEGNDLVCGGPNSVTLGPYSYTLLDPLTASPTSSMMNIGLSGVENGDGDVYDVHVTYFSDVNEYVVEYEGACDGFGAVRANNWLDDDDLVSLEGGADNLDQTSPCGANVVYHYNDEINSWMASTLDSTGIDYKHNNLEADQRDWAVTEFFSSAMPQWAEVYEMPSALTSVNDITNGKFGPHSFGAAATDYAVLSGTSSNGDPYLTTADGMTLYIYWGDNDGQTCGATCQETWPAFFGGNGMAVDPSLNDDDFGTITNTEGESQSTFQGWPLYTYVADTFPTDMTGNGVTDSGGTWYAAGMGYEEGPAGACVDSLNGGAPYSWAGDLCAGTYTLGMTDSWGDGWNGNDFVITNSAGAQLWTATLTSGSSGTDTFTLDEDTAVSISVGGGSWQSEVSWTFESSGDGFTISGVGSDIVTTNVPAGHYTLDMADSWGDGWNGNQWTLKTSAGVTLQQHTLSSGSSGSVSFTLDDDCNNCEAGITILGGWTYEVSWTLYASDPTDNPWDNAEDFPGRLEGNAPYGVGEFGVFNFPAGTYSLSMTDTWGDGWNGNALTLTDEDGNIIAQEGLTGYVSSGYAEFTIPEGTYNLDVGVTQPGSWDGEVGWSLVQLNYVPEGQHFTQLCITSNGAIAFTSGDDCTSSTRITDLYGFNGLMYQTEDTGFAAGASVYLQVQNILPQKILPFGPDNYIETGDGTQLGQWTHTVIEDTNDGDGSLTLDLSRMHPENPGLYYEVVSASELAALGGCDYDLFFSSVTDGDQDVTFGLISDATTNAPADEIDYLMAGGQHQSEIGACDIKVQLKEQGYVHHETPLAMIVDNVPEERPDYGFTGNWDYELVSAVLPGTLVPVTVQVTNNDDGVASQNGAMYDHGHSIDVCFSTNDYDECYYTAWIIDPPAPGATEDVQGQFVLDSGTELITTSLEVHTCDTPTLPGDMNNQDTCTLDAVNAASLNGLTRKGAKVTPYSYDDEHSATLEQTNGPQSETNNDMSETNERPLRISYGVANSVPSFAPSLMAIGLVGLFAAALVQGSRSSEEEDDEEELVDDEAAVSPVIATILMVAITVVLSGVIYVWASQLATTSTKVTPLLTFKTEASDTFWQITVTTAENPLALQAVYVQVEFVDESCENGYCIFTQTIAMPQTYGFTPGNSDSHITYMDMYDCSAGEGTDGCVAEFSAMDVLRINFEFTDNNPDSSTFGETFLIEEGIVQLAYQAGGDTNILGEWNVDSSTPSIK